MFFDKPNSKYLFLILQLSHTIMLCSILVTNRPTLYMQVDTFDRPVGFGDIYFQKHAV